MIKLRASALENLNTLLNLISLAKEIYQNRFLILRVVKLLFKALRWFSVKSLGVGACFLGVMVLSATPVGVWQYFHTPGMFTASTTVPSMIGVMLGVGVFLGISGLLLGLGTCALAPRSRAARYFRSRILKRPLRDKTAVPNPARSVFGLFMRSRPT